MKASRKIPILNLGGGISGRQRGAVEEQPTWRLMKESEVGNAKGGSLSTAIDSAWAKPA